MRPHNLGLLALVLLAAPPAVAQSNGRTTTARQFGELALTPHGALLAWIGPRTRADDAGLNLTSIGGSAPTRRVVAPVVRESIRSLAWSADGARLAFLGVDAS